MVTIASARVSGRIQRLTSEALFSFLIILGLSLCAVGTGASERPRHINVDPEGYSISRYDPVAYFTRGRPMHGRAEIYAEYKGAKYAFVSEEHRKLFLMDPEKYTPQYGGYCAYGVAHGSKSDVDPEVWEIVDGKLFLLLSAGTHTIWQKNRIAHIKRADSAWKSISDR